LNPPHAKKAIVLEQVQIL